MILQVKNCADFNQEITLHTGEAKTIFSGTAIKINTGSDRRLASYYASLISYCFDVTILQGTGNEHDIFNDAKEKIQNSIDESNKLKVFNGDKSVYPKSVEDKISESKIDDKVYGEEPKEEVYLDSHGNGTIYENKPTTVMDSHGNTEEVKVNQESAKEVVEEVKVTEQIPENADEMIKESGLKDEGLLAPKEIKVEVNKPASTEVDKEAEAKYKYDVNANKLDEAFNEAQLKQLIKEEFDVKTRYTKKSSLIWEVLNHVDYAEDETLVDKLISKYIYLVD